MRAMWKGVIRMKDLEVPVKLYSGVEDKAVRFRLLHAKDLSPVEQKMVNPATGKEVEYSDIRRGYEVRPGVFVMLKDEELKQLEPEPSRDIEVSSFVAPELIDHRWYERPYFLGPDESDEVYQQLHQALLDAGVEGLVHWTMRNKAYVGALRAADEGLVIMTLRNTNEVVLAKDLPRPEGRELDRKEREMANLLIDSLATELDMSDWQDLYRKRVLELIETKAAGGEVKVKKFRAKKTDDDSLTKALEASLAKVRKKA